MNNRALKELSRLVPLFLVVLSIAIAARLVSSQAIDDTSQKSAQIIASDWTNKVVSNIPDIEAVLAGDKLVTGAIMSDLAQKQPKEVKAYRLFDASKILRLERAGSGISFDEAIAIGKKTTQSMRDIHDGGGGYYKKTHVNKDLGVSFGSRIILPLIKNRKTIGYIEILEIETTSFERFREQYSKVTFQFTILMLAAFLLPAILYLRRTDQLELASKSLQRSADYDELTGALNRSAFTKIVENELKQANERGYCIAIHFIDLDRFKEINDSRGHSAGDEVLKKTTKRLEKILNPRERFARLGGDEFAIIQPYFIGSSNTADELANNIVQEMSKSFGIEGSDIFIGASLGYSHFPRDGKTVSELLRTSDIALYKAKQEGRNRALEFNLSMESERQSRHAIEERLRSALLNDDFYLNFQPYYDLQNNELRGFEALLRVNDVSGEPISPEIFIPIAEEMGLIGDIGEWVLKEACKISKDWPSDKMISVNLSPDQFKTHNMPELVKEILASSGLSPNRLELEVTEGLLITDTDSVLSELLAIKELGVAIALDDFGTGYSSLSYLWQFPFDKLKIDKSFINTLDVEGSKSHEILSTIIALGKVLNLKVTAEGVETKEQATILKSFDCDLVQGYLYSRPLNVVDVASALIGSFKGGKKADKIKSELIKLQLIKRA